MNVQALINEIQFHSILAIDLRSICIAGWFDGLYTRVSLGCLLLRLLCNRITLRHNRVESMAEFQRIPNRIHKHPSGWVAV
jgi:hypothetical protein